MKKQSLSLDALIANKFQQKLLNNCLAGGVTILSFLLLNTVLNTYTVSAETTDFPTNFSSIKIADSVNLESAKQPESEANTSEMNQVTNVNQLSDVQPTDWAFQALQSLVERYGCIAGYPNSTFRGNRAMTRYEFAAGLNACLERVNELIATATNNLAKKEDLETLQKLQEEFTAELATLRGRVDTLEAKTAELEANQFSTTTKLQGQVIISANTGGFSGDRIIDATGRQVTRQPNATIAFRAGIDLNTSFSGTDLLKVRLEQGSGFDENGQPVGGKDNAAGFLEPFFGSALDYSINPPTSGKLELSRLYYSFAPTQDLNISIGPAIRAADFMDFNSYASLSFRDFGTQAFSSNYILFPINFPSGGALISWKPGNGALSIRAAYAAADVFNPGDEGPINGTLPFTQVLYPNDFRPTVPGSPPSPRGSRGLFGDTYQGTVEVEYAPSRNFALRLQYAGGEVFTNHFDAIAANVEVTLAEKFGIFGRYGYSNYNGTAFGDISPNYWMAGIAMRDLFTRGSLAGFAVGQPFIVAEIGDATQTNYELFYNYPFSRNIQVTPAIQIIENAGNQGSNGTIYSGSLRTVFSF
ncbi:MAG: iron uptake porin [Methylacidiphilales bacterium]|nr:iron uptake porin [Candidatus Methylacidiphilales bacterium]NJR15390.1 iron uptake porin [Calothrix sp. CSU_2_0]